MYNTILYSLCYINSGMPEKQPSVMTSEKESNILRHHRSDLFETLHNNPTDLTSLAKVLSIDGIIDHFLEDKVKRGQGKKEVVEQFLDKLEKIADEKPIDLNRLFNKMAHFHGTLCTITEELRKEASKDTDLAITTG